MEMTPEWLERCRVPAFGEWNYPCDGDGAGVDDWPLTPYFDAFVRIAAPPPAHKTNKWARPNARRSGKRIPAFGEWNRHGGDDGTWPAAAVTPFFDLATAHRTPNKTERWDGDAGVTAAKLSTAEPRGRRPRSKVTDSGAYAARRSCFTVAKPVDDDLYGIPPEMIFEYPSKTGGWLRILLMRYCCCLCPRGSC